MADNVTIPATGTGDATPKVAADELTYSGDTAKVQLVRQVFVSGTEGSKALTEVVDANGIFVQGNVAHDATNAGFPVQIGCEAIAHGTNPTAVAAGDRTKNYANRAGIPFRIGGHPNVITRTARVADADGAQTGVAIGPTVGTGAKMVITRISVMASNANTVNVRAKIAFSTSTTLPSDATGGTAGILADHPAVPPGGGFTIGDGSGIIAIGADDEELRWTVDDPVGGAITCSFSYYTVES